MLSTFVISGTARNSVGNPGEQKGEEYVNKKKKRLLLTESREENNRRIPKKNPPVEQDQVPVLVHIRVSEMDQFRFDRGTETSDDGSKGTQLGSGNRK